MEQCSVCRNSMSPYEKKHFQGQCGECFEKQQQEAVQLRKKQQEEKKRQEELEKKQKIERERTRILGNWDNIVGRTIAGYEIVSWKNVFGTEEPDEVTLHFTDGTRAHLESFTDSDGCMGCYEYDHHLECDFFNPDK